MSLVTWLLFDVFLGPEATIISPKKWVSEIFFLLVFLFIFPVTKNALVYLSGRLPEANVSNNVSTANGVTLDLDGVKPPESPSKSLPTNVGTVPNGEVQTGECATYLEV